MGKLELDLRLFIWLFIFILFFYYFSFPLKTNQEPAVHTVYSAELGGIKKMVNIQDYGAVGDGKTNDYEAFKRASEAAGPDGILYFPKTINNAYYFNNGLTGKDARIKAEGKPYFLFESEDVTLNYYYDPDLKYLKTLNSFNLKWGKTVKRIDNNAVSAKIGQSSGEDFRGIQTLQKLNMVSDVTLMNFNGTSYKQVSGYYDSANDLIKFVGSSSGYNLAMTNLAIGEYTEFLFVRDDTVPDAGHYDIAVATDNNSYIVELNSIYNVLSIAKWNNGKYNLVNKVSIPSIYQLNKQSSAIYGIKNVDGANLEIYINGYKATTLVLDNEKLNNVGFGHNSSQNGHIEIKNGLRILNYNSYESDKIPTVIKTKYFAFGDSITYGAYSTKDYPTMVSDILYYKTGTRSLEVYNYGVSGDTSQHTITRVQKALPSIDSNSVVTIQIGTNDVQTGVPVEQYIKNVSTIIDTLRVKTTKIVIASFPLYNSTQPNYNKIALYNSELKQLALEKNITFVDNYSQFGYNLDKLPDNIHPDEDGLMLLAKSFANAIYELLSVR